MILPPSLSPANQLLLLRIRIRIRTCSSSSLSCQCISTLSQISTGILLLQVQRRYSRELILPLHLDLLRKSTPLPHPSPQPPPPPLQTPPSPPPSRNQPSHHHAISTDIYLGTHTIPPRNSGPRTSRGMLACARVRAGVCALEMSAPPQEQHTTLPADGTFGCMSAPGSLSASG